MWLDPEGFEIDTSDRLEVNIKNGEKLQGRSVPYIPNRIEKFFWSQNGEKIYVDSRLGDIPAFSEMIHKSGLISFVYVSKPSILNYKTLAKFEKFAQHKDLGPVREMHLNFGFPEQNFRETYQRFAKAIVAVGPGTGNDANFGLITEFILLTNPYTSKNLKFLELRLNFEGKPRRNAQVEVFERAIDGKVSIFITRTSDEGIVVIPAKKGYEYLFDAVKLRSARPSAGQTAVWETLWAALMVKIPI